MQDRRRTGSHRGGDSTTAEHLVAGLEALGHEVLLTAEVPPDGADRFDAVHAWNIDRSIITETEDFVRAARRARRRLVVTPIWWPLDDFVAELLARERAIFRTKGLRVLRLFRERRWRVLRRLNVRQRAVLSAADMVCVSGPSEGHALQARFGPLPIDLAHRAATDVRPETGPAQREGVLCVARLDPRKNQLGLIEAMGRSGIPLRLVGTEELLPSYAKACREAAGPDVEFTGYLSPDELDAAYRSARVHVMPSWFELPGLTSFDAAAAGCCIVISTGGTAGDYFGRDAHYCGTDTASIRRSVLSAYEEGPIPGLAERIASECTWAATTDLYLNAYGIA